MKRTLGPIGAAWIPIAALAVAILLIWALSSRAAIILPATVFIPPPTTLLVTDGGVPITTDAGVRLVAN